MKTYPFRVPKRAIGLRPLHRIAIATLWATVALYSPVSRGQERLADAGAGSAQEDSGPAPGGSVAEEIIVSAQRLEVAVETVGSSVTVLDQEEIERRGKTTVLELLRTVAGVEVAQSGGPGKITSVRIRGGNTAQALVLIDGQRANSATNGDFDFADLMANNVERIEIVRGPQAALYGSEAVTGVVSITTRRGREGFLLHADAEAGTHDERRFRLSLSGGRGRGDYSLSASDFSTEGVSAASERLGNTEKDPHENRSASGRFGLDLGANGRADLTVRYFEGETGLDGFFGDELDFTAERQSLTTALAVKKSFNKVWTQTFSVGVHEDDLLGKDPDTFFNNFEIDTRTSQFQSQSDLLLGANDTLSLGYSVEKREGLNVGGFDESVYLRSLFLHNRWEFRERLYLTAALRNDDHSRFGDETSYSATLSLLFPATASRLHASFGTSFRAPNLNELYFPGSGDPNLRPETGSAFDVGLTQAWLKGRLTFDVTYFDNDFDDLIAFDLVSFTFGNIADATSDGAEVTLSFRPTEHLGIEASHTYNETEDAATGEPLARRPKNRSVVSVTFEPHERLRGFASVIAVRDRIDSDGTTMDDYERLDLTLDYSLTSRLRPYLRVENLLDEDYEEVTGFTTPGLTAALGIALDL